MIKETIYIEKPIDEVWNFVEMEFAKVFKTSPSKLIGKTITVETMNFTGKMFNIEQSITTQEKNKELILRSESGKDIVLCHYQFDADGENGTYLTSFEDGEGKSSKLRTWNYTLMTLPILRGSSKKKLRRRLEGIKMMLEEGEQKDDTSIEPA